MAKKAAAGGDEGKRKKAAHGKKRYAKRKAGKKFSYYLGFTGRSLLHSSVRSCILRIERHASIHSVLRSFALRYFARIGFDHTSANKLEKSSYKSLKGLRTPETSIFLRLLVN